MEQQAVTQNASQLFVPTGVHLPSPNTVYMPNIKGTSMPFLAKGPAADTFPPMRAAVLAGAGFDFLATLGDMMRPQHFVSTKPGVALYSNHKIGRAIDFNQGDQRYLLVPEIIGGRQYWRTYLKCSEQDGSLGAHRQLHSDIMGNQTGYFFDFTACAESFGWLRIPAWRTWSNKGPGSNKREFWHYQNMKDRNGHLLTWQEGYDYLYSSKAIGTLPVRLPDDQRIIGLNDRGEDVKALELLLYKLGLINQADITGIFADGDLQAICHFQERNGLKRDGRVGPKTMTKLVAAVG
ncbi:MAG: peptidoglycan-binding domain-containing protein [Pyrinomonadaceae bacterium]